jgi:hypothetical protein
MPPARGLISKRMIGTGLELYDIRGVSPTSKRSRAHNSLMSAISKSASNATQSVCGSIVRSAKRFLLVRNAQAGTPRLSYRDLLLQSRKWGPYVPPCNFCPRFYRTFADLAAILTSHGRQVRHVAPNRSHMQRKNEINTPRLATDASTHSPCRTVSSASDI